MGSAHQEERSSAPISRRWHLVSKLAIGLATLLLMFIASNYHLSRVNTIIDTHRMHLELQRKELDQHAEIVRRGLQELIDRSAAILPATKTVDTDVSKNTDVSTDKRILSARGISDFFSSLTGGGAAAGGATGGGGITGAISGLLPNISTAGIEDGLVVPSKYFGVGVASGALMGMKMPVKVIDTSIDPKPSGLNGIAENFGSSTTSTFVASIAANQSNSTASSQKLDALLDGSNGMVGQAVLALSQGIGSGTASGLKLNDKPVGVGEPAYNTSGANGIAGNFGNGLTTTFFSGIDIQKLTGGAAVAPAADTPALTPRQFARAAVPDLNALFDGSNGLVGQAALAFTQGVGSGTATGLKLNDKKAGSPVYDTNGINGVAGNVGNGLTSSFFDGLDIQKLTAAAGTAQGGQKLTTRQAAAALLDGSNGQVGQAVLALSQGIGSGTATGLKLNNRKAGDPPVYDTTGANGVAGNVGDGLTRSFFDGIDISKIQALINPPAGAPKVTARQMAATANSILTDPAMLSMLAQAAAGVGIGLGSGTAVGLGLQEANSLQTSTKATANGEAVDGLQQITQNFASGITSSFLMGGTVVKLKAALAPGGSLEGLIPNNRNANPFPNLKLNQVAQGFAVGLVAGAGSVIPQTKIFTADTRSFNDSVDGTSLGLGQGFGQGGAFLISKLLNLKDATLPPGIGVSTDSTAANAGATDPLISSVLGGSVGAGINPASVPAPTPGFDPSAPALPANDQAPAPASTPAAEPAVAPVAAASIVDPTAAAATDPLLASTLSGGTLSDPATPAAAPAATPVPDPASAPAAASSAGTDPFAPAPPAKRRFLQARSKIILTRQSSDASSDIASLGESLGLNIPGGITNATDIQSVISSTDASKISPFVQMGADDLTCVGLGGLYAVRFGLFKSGTLDPNKVRNFTKPDATFRMTSDGNNYELNPAKDNLTVNGHPRVKLIVLLVFHVALGLGVYFAMVPLLLGLHSRRNMNAYFGGPMNLMPKNQKIASYSVYPLALFIFILGVVPRGNATHFSTVHGGLGLVTILQTIAAGGFAIALAGPLKNSLNSSVRLAQKANFALFIGLSSFVLASGYSDISTLTLCALQAVVPTSVVILVGLAIMTPILLLQGTLMTEMFVKKRGQAIVLGNDMESNARILEEKEQHVLEISSPFHVEQQ